MINATATTTPRFDTGVEESTPAGYDPVVLTRTTWWGAIVAGAVTAMSLMVIFAILGTAIGLSVISATSDTPEAGLGIGAAIYWMITGLVAMFVGGWVASRLRRTSDAGIGATHGFLAWGTVTVISSILLALSGGVAVGGSLAAAGDVMQANQNSVRSSDRTTSEGQGDPVSEQEAKEAAKKAAGASWWTLAALVMGAGVASLGGASAARKYDYDCTHGLGGHKPRAKN